MKKVNAIIVDDESGARELLQAMLAEFCPQVNIVDSCNSVSQAVESINSNAPDVIFLDINMPHGSGFDLLKQFSNPQFKCIFTTAYNEFAIQAIRFSALDYLLKPIDVDELVAAVNKISTTGAVRSLQFSSLQKNLTDTGSKMENVILPIASGFVVEKVKDIVRIESVNNYVVFYNLNGAQTVVHKTLKHYEELLQESGFLRVHQSHLINTLHIKKYSKGDNPVVTMADGSTVGIARNKKSEFVSIFLNGAYQ